MAVTSLSTLALFAPILVIGSLAWRIIHSLYFHPLSKFHGPWYAASFSIVHALASALKVEHEWLLQLTKRYGASKPIRIAPNLLLFPQPSAVKEIYWDSKLNTKGLFYGSGALGPPHLFTTLDGDQHKELRKAIGGPHYTIGTLKNHWEPRFDDLILTALEKWTEKSERGETIQLCDKVAEFAADVMTMVSFSEPWGFVRNDRDERELLKRWRDSLPYFGFVNRFRWFRDVVMKSSWGVYFLPSSSDNTGMGFFMREADRQVTIREYRMKNEQYSQECPDFLQHCLEARIGTKPLSPVQKRAHITLLFQAGADTTGTALGCTFRFLVTNPDVMSRCQAEIDAADQAGKLSSPIVQYEETRTHLPLVVACIRESLRLHPPAPTLFPRIVPRAGGDGLGAKKTSSSGGFKTIGDVVLPPGFEITTHPYVVQRDPVLYAPDPEVFRPERWLEASPEKLSEMEAGQFTFGVGPRVCLGKDVAYMELYKLIPQVLRTFDMDLQRPGQFVVAGGVAFNNDFAVKLRVRKRGETFMHD
ncbi:hypothetical protein MCOR27_010367 [Pyricularia oryzae]|uniref:Cytochrome P450 n=1 Tax=Pyricularia grisea TaxID=148305 RepID=A0ABQ8NJ87_PYRGI|nr:hypothetical protein MCOR27_010367 [Pyricularia oryzae]KAI6297518.1 hypothetical protein MCOR33_006171 [Pyricularia grisea]KAI6269519.1 hypothetical protein MCOR26_008668 [Pyricularia oryzae]KAI6329979.1 hypothetical protein MCOR29_002065 [Pyricularia oryzae]KAI6345913.1 hypothetical protein MCOR28_003287 [Pyricularia oryzae]